MATTDTLDPLKTELNKGLMATSKIGASIPKSASVAENVANITSQDSALMQQAKTQGLQAANRRGLLNSSMAVGASQDAVIRAAAPIAAQDANTASNQYLAAQDRTLAELQQQRDIGSREGMQQRDISAQKQMQERQLSEAEKQQIRDIGFRQGESAADRALEETIQNKSFALQEQIAKWNLDSNDRNAAAQFLTNMTAAYNDKYSAIMANTALTAAQRTDQLTSAKNLRDIELDFVQQLFDVSLEW